ncbi:MAG: Sec-independent protein translocase protein TatB [Acetobacteraceae bacterium]
MFDFAWSELGVIAVVALIFIGPKDLPVALKSMTGMIKKARGMASEFQTHVDDLVREADLHEVRNQLTSLRSYGAKGALGALIDQDGSIRRSFEDPLITPAPTPSTYESASDVAGDLAVAELLEVGGEIVAEPAAAETQLEAGRPDTPAFIPPGMVPASIAASGCAEPPAFIPPEFARLGPAA